MKSTIESTPVNDYISIYGNRSMNLHGIIDNLVISDGFVEQMRVKPLNGGFIDQGSKSSFFEITNNLESERISAIELALGDEVYIEMKRGSSSPENFDSFYHFANATTGIVYEAHK